VTAACENCGDLGHVGGCRVCGSPPRRKPGPRPDPAAVEARRLARVEAGAAFKAKRLAAGCTCGAVAKQLGITRAAVAAWESGAASVPPDADAALAAAVAAQMPAPCGTENNRPEV